MDIRELQQKTLKNQIRVKIEYEEAARKKRERELDNARENAQKLIDRTPLMIEETVYRGEYCIDSWHPYHGATRIEDKKVFPIKGKDDISDFLMEWADREGFCVYIYKYCSSQNYLALSWSPEDYA